MTRILLVGGGGREHALAWRLKRDDPALELIAAPGNPGIAALARCVAVGPMEVDALVDLARAEHVDAVFVGPEGPLAAGLVDQLRAEGIAAFGPTAAAAQLESSKAFAKEVMRDAGVPTAHSTTHTSIASAKRAAQKLGAPVVIKASGLAGGKGAVVCETLADAERTIDDFLGEHVLGAAGDEVLVEEFMRGETLSFFVLTDGTNAVPLISAQDHKRLLAGDRGPNTGGMGAYAPVAVATPALIEQVMRTIVAPTLAEMRTRGTPFEGLLFTGLMLTADGPKVVEFNCRFGDPETQVVLPVLRGSLLDAMLAIARGQRLGPSTLTWNGRYAVTTIVAAEGYPGNVRTGDEITLPALRAEVLVFHAGTALDKRGAFVTAGGRVLALTGVASTFDAAQTASRATAQSVMFSGKQFRNDIGWRETQRHTRDV